MSCLKPIVSVTVSALSLILPAPSADAAMAMGDIVVLGTQGSGTTYAFAGDGANLNQLGSDAVNWGSGQTRVAIDPTTGHMIFGASSGRLFRYDFDTGTQTFSQVGVSSTIYSDTDGIQDLAVMNSGTIITLGVSPSTGKTFAFAARPADLNQQGSAFLDWGTGQTSVAYDALNDQLIFGANNGRLFRYSYDKDADAFAQVGTSSGTVYGNAIQDVTVMADGTIIVLGVSPTTGKTLAFAAQGSSLNQQGSAFIDWGIGRASVAYDALNDELIFGANNGRLFRYSYDKDADAFTQIGASSSTIYSAANGIQGVAVAPIPEPACLAMMGVGGLVMLCRHPRRA